MLFEPQLSVASKSFDGNTCSDSIPSGVKPYRIVE